jgi:hypothetical protein
MSLAQRGSHLRNSSPAEEAASLEKRLTDVSTNGGECRRCHNAEARAAGSAAAQHRKRGRCSASSSLGMVRWSSMRHADCSWSAYSCTFRRHSGHALAFR